MVGCSGAECAGQVELPSTEDSQPISLIGFPFPLVFEYKKKPNSSPTVRSAAETSNWPHFPSTALISIPSLKEKSCDMLLEMSFAPTFSQFPGSNDNFSTGEHAVESVIVGVEDSPNLGAIPNKGTACDAYAFIFVIIGKDDEEVGNVALTASVAKNTKSNESIVRFA
jgi:hypothetical protein